MNFLRKISTAVMIKTLITLMNGSSSVDLSSFNAKISKIGLNFYLNSLSFTFAFLVSINFSRKIG
jgi:hypothetical protein